MRRPSAPLMGEGAYTHIDPMFSVEADTPGCPPLPLWDNSPSVLIVPHILFQGGFRRQRAASPFWSDPKGAKRSPGDGSGEHQVVLSVACPRAPVYEGSLVRETGAKIPARGGL